jgi:hypothetical protein
LPERGRREALRLGELLSVIALSQLASAAARNSGLVFILLAPKLARRIGEALTRDAGLEEPAQAVE